MEILKVDGLCKTYGSGESRVEALKNASFTLKRENSRPWWENPGREKVRF